MTRRRLSSARSRAVPALTRESLERLALAYVGRYATTRARLRDYLRRKLAERGWAAGNGAQEDDPADVVVDAIVRRFGEKGYVDDRAVAEARGRMLAARGYGARRLTQALAGLGIEAGDAAPAREEADARAWDTALLFARLRRLGPFADHPPDPAARRRAVAAMIRAGHSFEHARRILDAQFGAVPEWDDT